MYYAVLPSAVCLENNEIYKKCILAQYLTSNFMKNIIGEKGRAIQRVWMIAR